MDPQNKTQFQQKPFKSVQVCCSHCEWGGREEQLSHYEKRAASLSFCFEYLEVVELGAGEEAFAGTWAGVTWSAGLQMERQQFVSISRPI